MDEKENNQTEEVFEHIFDEERAPLLEDEDADEPVEDDYSEEDYE